MKIQFITLVTAVAVPYVNAGILGSFLQRHNTHSLGLDRAFPGKSLVSSVRQLIGGDDEQSADDDDADDESVDTTTNDECPQVWYDIASDLKGSFSGCSRNAAAAIRFAFHDSAGYSSRNNQYAPATGGADGSLLLSDEEIARQINDPMQNFREFLLDKYNQYSDQGVSAADFVQAAGNIGVISCRGGVKVKTVVGREDSSDAPPEGTLPFAFGPGANYDTIIQLFEDKGINPRELAALMGAHSVSRAFSGRAGIPRGGPQDSTSQSWDTRYFSQTQAAVAPRGVYRFDSDVNLANPNTTCGEAYTEFADDKSAWDTAFQDAMYKFSLLGVPGDTRNGLTDCTDILD